MSTQPQLTEHQKQAIADVCRTHGVTLCYLYGSRADGFANAHSDWDLGVVFENNRGARPGTAKWLDMIGDLEMILPPESVDLVFLDQATPFLRQRAIRGIRLYAATDLDRAKFEEQVMRIWMDLRPFIDAFHHDQTEAILSGHLIG